MRGTSLGFFKVDYSIFVSVEGVENVRCLCGVEAYIFECTGEVVLLNVGSLSEVTQELLDLFIGDISFVLDILNAVLELIVAEGGAVIGVTGCHDPVGGALDRGCSNSNGSSRGEDGGEEFHLCFSLLL